MSFESSACETGLPRKTWRQDAARIVEELFPVTPSATWNLLLDLRENLLKGSDWNHTLDVFLACRVHLEAEHYLPFYRLRRLLTGSLRLEAGSSVTPVTSLKQILIRKHRSLADITRAVSRECFEHDLTATVDQPIQLRVVER